MAINKDLPSFKTRQRLAYRFLLKINTEPIIGILVCELPASVSVLQNIVLSFGFLLYRSITTSNYQSSTWTTGAGIFGITYFCAITASQSRARYTHQTTICMTEYQMPNVTIPKRYKADKFFKQPFEEVKFIIPWHTCTCGYIPNLEYMGSRISGICRFHV